MYKSFVISILLLFSLTSLIAQESKSIKSEETWSGKVSNTLLKEVPESKLISSQEQFTKIWGKWATTKMPTVDFKTHLLYVHTYDANDPNRLSARFVVNDGVLRVMVISTRMGFKPDGQNSKYDIHKIPRAGIDSIEIGKMVAGKYTKKTIKLATTPTAEKADDKIAGYIAELDKFEKKWLAESPKHNANYTYSSNRFGGMMPVETTVVTVTNGKITSRQVSSKLFPTIKETGKAINANKHGIKAITMEEAIARCRKILKKHDDKVDRLYFKIKGFDLVVLSTPRMMMDHPGKGVRITKFSWK